MKNPYEVLGVRREADATSIRAAYRQLARAHHPDRGGSDERMGEINAAYEVLSDEEKRARFDRTGDSRKPDDPEIVAEAAVAQMINQWLSDPSESGENVVAAFLNNVRIMRIKIESEIHGMRNGLAVLERKRTRITGPLDVGHMIDERQAALRTAIENCERQLLINKHVEELLGKFTDNRASAGTQQDLSSRSTLQSNPFLAQLIGASPWSTWSTR